MIGMRKVWEAFNDEYVAMDSRFKVWHVDNGGVSDLEGGVNNRNK